MNDEKTCVIVENDDFVRQKLSDFIQNSEFSGVCHVTDSSKSADSVLEFDFPIRAGAILDRIQRFSRIESSQDIAFGPYRLAVQQLTLYRDGDEVARLTEKETALLRILHDKKGQSVSRDVLLDQVWDYAEGVETHTLETHMYRLRQKIEDDPSNPQYLMTDEDGYFLNLG